MTMGDEQIELSQETKKAVGIMLLHALEFSLVTSDQKKAASPRKKERISTLPVETIEFSNAVTSRHQTSGQ